MVYFAVCDFFINFATDKTNNMDSHFVQTRQEVERFLNAFFPKMKIFGVLFLGRDKNDEALRMLGMSPLSRLTVLEELKAEDYVETIRDLTSFGDMYVFGKDYDGHELYIKISLGQPNRNTICVSFHIAEHEIDYPYKEGGEK